MDDDELWCRVTIVGPDGEEVASVALEGAGFPDLGTVDKVARLTLIAGRLGGEIALTEVSPALRALLELAGLPVQMEGQPELWEEPLRVERCQEE
ncbi:MAG: hypothetical protein L3J72_05325, partial [Thermoplasmata archaeon]|nr:hypothetical protein [Thermoplasmata archaeon]